MKRNEAIDYGRFIFAFLIVTIHIPCFMNSILLPIARCGVPYFFLITGYYLYTPDKLSLRDKLKKNIHKWIQLWIKYTIILTTLLFILKLIFINENEFKCRIYDIYNLLSNGISQYTDVLIANNTPYGISVLWFLYGGFQSFIFFYFFNSHLDKTWFKILILSIFILSLSINYFSGGVVIYRFISVVIPFVYIGYLLKKNENSIIKIRLRSIIILSSLLIIILYLEAFFTKKVEIYISTPWLIILIFILLVKRPDLFKRKLKISSQVAMDIYIWHRFLWILTSILFIDICKITYYKEIAPVIVFLTILITSSFLRTQKHSQRKYPMHM